MPPRSLQYSALLSLLGLPPVGLHEAKQRFRELAKRYHPDHGEQLVEAYDWHATRWEQALP
jgi:curved DNA-binding protein CbpA